MPYIRNKTTGQTIYVPDQPTMMPVGPQNPDYPYKGPQAAAGIANTQASTGRTVVQTQGDRIDNAVKAATQRPMIDKARAEAAIAQANALKATTGAQDEAKKQYLSKVAGMMTGDKVLKTIAEAKGLIGPWTTGTPGTLFSHIPGTEAYQLGGDLGTVTGNISFDAYKAMKENMPTGAQGGIRLTDNELKLLGSISGNISQGLDRKTLSHHLSDIEQQYRINAALNAGLDPQDPNVQHTLGISSEAVGPMMQALHPTQHPAQHANTIDFNDLPDH